MTDPEPQTDTVSSWLLVTSAELELKSISNPVIFPLPYAAWLTGLPRFLSLPVTEYTPKSYYTW